MRNKLTVILYAYFKLLQLRIKEFFIRDGNTIKRVELDEEYEKLAVLIYNTFYK